MIIKIRNKFLGTSHEKHLSAPKDNLKHTCAHKSLLSIYIIHNYIIYRFVCPRVLYFRDFTYLRIRLRVVSVSVCYIGKKPLKVNVLRPKRENMTTQ